jgi:hypothetical protein
MLRKCPDCTIDKPESDFGRLSPRCRSCAKIRTRHKLKEAKARYLTAHPDAQGESNRKFYAKNKQRQKARAQAWREQNRERVAAVSKASRQTPEWQEWRRNYRPTVRKRELAQQRARYAANPEPYLAVARAWKKTHPEDLVRYSAEYYRAHPEVNRRNRARYRARLIQATPVWADFDKINAFYDEAVRVTRQTGIPHEVDHIYPLRGKNSCGLHVEANLQVVPSTVNRRKKNRPPEMSEPRCCAWPSVAHFESLYLEAA